MSGYLRTCRAGGRKGLGGSSIADVCMRPEENEDQLSRVRVRKLMDCAGFHSVVKAE